MSVSNRLANYLTVTQTDYELRPHAPSQTAAQSAHAAHVSETSVVKGVMLRDRRSGRYLMALTPASNRLRLGWVVPEGDSELVMAREEELVDLFPDCDLGAVPGFGQAYGLDMIWDDQLARQDQLYFEAGNHKELVKIDHDDFLKLFSSYRHAKISMPGGRRGQFREE